MKNIGVFCDGTWQHLGQRADTNVALLARAAEPEAHEDGGRLAQVVYYDDGVGVGAGVVNGLVSALGGALGQGLDYKVMRAYEFLSLNYDPGDRIFLFGFSRGAYTARSLAGLVRWLGLLKRESACFAEAAMALYRQRPPKSADEARRKADLRAFVDRVATFRTQHCHAPRLLPDGDPDDPAARGTPIDHVGVWDTVGALGVPRTFLLSAWLNRGYGFYDPSLSAFVRSARHAVSIDERRETFPPTLWDNIETLNHYRGADALPYAERPYQQRWFPGGHAGVGGGQKDRGLSKAPLLWVAQGAERAGFAFHRGAISRWEAEANPLASFHVDNSLAGRAIRLLGQGDRKGPARLEEVSDAACQRWRTGEPDYRPEPLRHLIMELSEAAAGS